MSELAEITGEAAANSSVLPGHTFTAWSLAEIAAAETAFERKFIETVTIGLQDASEVIRDQAIAAAQEKIAWGIFSYGAPAFWVATRSGKHLGLMLYLSLRQADKKLTLAAAETLVTLENKTAVTDAARKAAGFNPAPLPNAQSAATQADDAARA